MARYYKIEGKEVTCGCCHRSFNISERNLHQPSYTIQVHCHYCQAEIVGYMVWSNRDLFERSTQSIFEEAIDTLGFLPLYDADGWPLTFSSEIHKGGGPGEGYGLIKEHV